MQLILDTCSWLKIQKLDKENVIQLKEFLYETDLWGTTEIMTELKHYLSNYLEFQNFSIRKVNIQKMNEFTEKELDPADLSLIEFGRLNPDCIIISDDCSLLQVLDMFKIKCFQISEFIYFLIRENILKKNIAIKSIKTLQEWKNIKKKKKVELLSKIAAI